jgi:hypothetical protein
VMPHQITLAEPVRVRCRGRVRRTEIKDTDRVGVVVEIQQYRFLRENEKTVARTKRKKQSKSAQTE